MLLDEPEWGSGKEDRFNDIDRIQASLLNLARGLAYPNMHVVESLQLMESALISVVVSPLTSHNLRPV